MGLELVVKAYLFHKSFPSQSSDLFTTAFMELDSDRTYYVLAFCFNFFFFLLSFVGYVCI